MRIGQESSYNGRFCDNVAVIDEGGDLAALATSQQNISRSKVLLLERTGLISKYHGSLGTDKSINTSSNGSLSSLSAI